MAIIVSSSNCVKNYTLLFIKIWQLILPPPSSNRTTLFLLRKNNLAKSYNPLPKKLTSFPKGHFRSLNFKKERLPYKI